MGNILESYVKKILRNQYMVLERTYFHVITEINWSNTRLLPLEEIDSRKGI